MQTQLPNLLIDLRHSGGHIPPRRRSSRRAKGDDPMNREDDFDLQAKEGGIALLRVSLGVMYLAHSVLLKLFVFTLPGTAQFFTSLGLPGWLAYLTFFAEAIGGLMLVLGIQARWVALALSPFLLGALYTGPSFEWLGVQRAGRRLGVPRLPLRAVDSAVPAGRRRLCGEAVASALGAARVHSPGHLPRLSRNPEQGSRS
jgi:uncharacterized membrane protein YphA (DoxX/SURF4 family)